MRFISLLIATVFLSSSISSDIVWAATKKKRKSKTTFAPKKVKKAKSGWPNQKRQRVEPSPEPLFPEGAETPTAHGSIYSALNLSAGTNFGLNYLFTVMHFQLGILRNWVIGVSPLYSSSTLGTISANAIGAYGILAYYPRSYFEGFHIQVGVGATSISATSGASNEKKTSVLGNAVAGYRFTVIPHLNMSLAAGLQFATDPGLTLVDINFKGLRPLFSVDVGYNF